MAAAGIIKGIVAIMGVFGLSEANSAWYVILEAAGHAFFQYLPLLIAVTAARKFKMNEFTALAIGGALVYPTLTTTIPALADAGLDKIFGISLELPSSGSYLSTVMPSILAMWVASLIEKNIKKITPDVVKLFVVPFVTILVTVPLTFLVVGPVANLLTDWVSAGFQAVLSFSPILYGFLLGALWQVLVIFGLHWALVPLAIMDVATNGMSAILVAACLPNFTQTGVLGAIMLKTKEQKVRTISTPAFISSIFGVTEPAIYGVTLPMRTPFIMTCVAGAIQGALLGFFNTTVYTMGGMGLFAIPSYFTPKHVPAGANTDVNNVWYFLIAILMSFVLGFVLTQLTKIPYLYGGPKDASATTEEKVAEPVNDLKELKQEIIASPMIGQVVKLENVPDEVFASGAMGKGSAIDPADGTVVAPAAGEITLVFPTGHAIGMRTENGAEILIHVGMDTVSLAGKGFNTFVQVGDKVDAGQKLLEFDLATIREANLPVISPVIVTNSTEFEDVLTTQNARVNIGDYLLTTLA
ncbi:PTS system, beta-glucoside-specific IIABC component [Streptococcus infantarius subsp. infantarius]|nr:PTS system, beta-glucoside-specific IIABC component [Streptococcus infantarius subsp. infantarius]MCO4491085.1 PTS system, beta-glucoside-specific IIABC component [Streptococcus infantarius subsp. infantarius]MCO4492974.1 PTS system, beta-glucoside-specific IIABC component [Streptococcus infantarius subsp. infantarius]MCO4507038.1 PTS system, beta-glucoside-specific IIABC component [Streptococcus infantarius subsp. infantarius]MCO4509259.1 PTS system, beta-glucoside-specific IIABC component 